MIKRYNGQWTTVEIGSDRFSLMATTAMRLQSEFWLAPDTPVPSRQIESHTRLSAIGACS